MKVQPNNENDVPKSRVTLPDYKWDMVLDQLQKAAYRNRENVAGRALWQDLHDHVKAQIGS